MRRIPFLLPWPVLVVVLCSYSQAAVRDPIPEDIMKLRDPFKRPSQTIAKKIMKPFLENYPIDSFKVVAILTGPKKVRAMISAPEGKTFFVSENIKIGNKGGFIKKITPDSIIIEESTVNILGRADVLTHELSINKGRAADNSHLTEEVPKP